MIPSIPRRQLRVILPALTTILLLLLPACTKNEFTITVAQSPGASPVDLKIYYYASDKTGGRIITQDIPSFLYTSKAATCMAVRPTIVFVYSSGGRLLTIFYAERGDKIILRCQNGFWTATGNKLTDRLAAWQREHSTILQAQSPSDINRSIATYVSAHRSDPLSAILLFAYYHEASNPEQYRVLVSQLDNKALEPDITNALGRLPQPSLPSRIPAITLRSPQYLATVTPSDARATVYLFWYDEKKRSEAAAIISRRVTSDIQVADINMQADTLTWQSIVRGDSIKSWIHLWAPGAEQNSALAPLALPGPDYIIVADSKGTPLYRGTDAEKAMNKIAPK